jgi:hypothetical protein
MLFRLACLETSLETEIQDFSSWLSEKTPDLTNEVPDSRDWFKSNISMPFTTTYESANVEGPISPIWSLEDTFDGREYGSGGQDDAEMPGPENDREDDGLEGGTRANAGEKSSGKLSSDGMDIDDGGSGNGSEGGSGEMAEVGNGGGDDMEGIEDGSGEGSSGKNYGEGHGENLNEGDRGAGGMDCHGKESDIYERHGGREDEISNDGGNCRTGSGEGVRNEREQESDEDSEKEGDGEDEASDNSSPKRRCVPKAPPHKFNNVNAKRRRRKSETNASGKARAEKPIKLGQREGQDLTKTGSSKEVAIDVDAFFVRFL